MYFLYLMSDKCVGVFNNWCVMDGILYLLKIFLLVLLMSKCLYEFIVLRDRLVLNVF